MQFESGHEALQIWNLEAIRAAPLILKIWLGTMALSIGCSVFFLKNHRGAQTVLVLTAMGLVFTKFIAPQLGLMVFSGLVALTHVLLWPFSLYFLYRDDLREKATIYRIWIRWTGVIIAISLAFDFRDAFRYVAYLISA